MAQQPLMNKEQIVQNLKLLGEELEALHIQRPIQLLMIGGGYMLTQVGNRLTTEDVDVFTRLDRETEDYRLFRAAIHFIADDVSVSQKWVSDTIGDFMETVGPIPSGKRWLKHGMLEVYVPEMQYVLVLKLLASRDKDIPDIQALLQRLKIKKKARIEALLRRYADEQIVEDRRLQIDKVLDGLLPS